LPGPALGGGEPPVDVGFGGDGFAIRLDLQVEVGGRPARVASRADVAEELSLLHGLAHRQIVREPGEVRVEILDPIAGGDLDALAGDGTVALLRHTPVSRRHDRCPEASEDVETLMEVGIGIATPGVPVVRPPGRGGHGEGAPAIRKKASREETPSLSTGARIRSRRSVLPGALLAERTPSD
jgi:hypothetical protein